MITMGRRNRKMREESKKTVRISRKEKEKEKKRGKFFMTEGSADKEKRTI